MLHVSGECWRAVLQSLSTSLQASNYEVFWRIFVPKAQAHFKVPPGCCRVDGYVQPSWAVGFKTDWV